MNTENTPEGTGATEQAMKQLEILPGAFQEVLHNPALIFQPLYEDETPIEVFAADGTTIFANRAMLKLNGCKDASLLIGIYNYKNDKVCMDITGKEFVDRVFRGEALTYYDFPAPIQDVLDRGVIDEKPWEAATMDIVFKPVWDGDRFVCTFCYFYVKHMYHGKPDVVEAKKYIDEHWLEDFDSKAVSKALNISHDHLRSLFRQHTGMTMNDYYKKVKVDHIKEKLADKNRPISEVFDACGEDSRGWMAKVFKEITGMSPKEYRDGLKSERQVK